MGGSEGIESQGSSNGAGERSGASLPPGARLLLDLAASPL